MTTMRKALFAALTCSVLCACTTVVENPRPVASTDHRQIPVVAAPDDDRPSVDLTKVPVCDLLTEEQRQELDINRAGRNLKITLYEVTGCTWTDLGVANLVVPVTTEGIEAWTNGTRRGSPTEIEKIEGFPAIKVTLPGDPHRCDVMVDTNEGEYLTTAFSVVSNTPERYPEPCARAQELASAAMKTLLKD